MSAIGNVISRLVSRWASSQPGTIEEFKLAETRLARSARPALRHQCLCQGPVRLLRRRRGLRAVAAPLGSPGLDSRRRGSGGNRLGVQHRLPCAPPARAITRDSERRPAFAARFGTDGGDGRRHACRRSGHRRRRAAYHRTRHDRGRRAGLWGCLRTEARVRPHAPPTPPWTRALGRSGGDSFPSGHTAAAFAAAQVLADSRPAGEWTWRTTAYSLGALTAYARLDGNMHWLSDTVAGAALGMATGRFVSNRSESHAQESVAHFSVQPAKGGAFLSVSVDPYEWLSRRTRPE